MAGAGEPRDQAVTVVGGTSIPSGSGNRTSISLDDPHIAGLISWAYKDEQSMADPAEVAEAKAWIETYRPHLPNTILHTNQKANFDVDAVRTYMQEVQPDMIRCDPYPYRGSELNIYVYLYRSIANYCTLGLEGNDGTGNAPIP